MYWKAERLVYNLVDAGETVYYRVEPQYTYGNPVPHSVRIVVVVEHDDPIVRTIPNQF